MMEKQTAWYRKNTKEIAEIERKKSLALLQEESRNRIERDRKRLKTSTCGGCLRERGVAKYPSGIVLGVECLNKKIALNIA